MGFRDAAKVCEEILANGWATTPIAWDSRPFEPPVNAAWVRPQVFEGAAAQVSIGAVGNAHAPARFRHLGEFVIEVFVPLGMGAGAARGHADALAALYRGKRQNFVTFLAPTVIKIGAEQDRWWRLNVIVPFRWDAIF